MKKLTVLLITLVAMISSSLYGAYQLTNADVSVTEGKIVTYSYSGGGTAPTELIIPNTLHGQTITAVGEEAFAEKGLTSVSFPSSLLIIESAAFRNNSITELTLPNSVQEIWDWAFSSNSISSLVLSDNLQNIGSVAFNANSISQINGAPSNGIIYARNPDGTEDNTTIVSYGGSALNINFIPSNVRIIGPSSFSFNSLTDVTIPEGVTTIMSDAFSYNEIVNLNLPGTITSIESRAFHNNSISQINGVPSNGIVYARNPDGTEDMTTIISYGGSSKVINFIPEGVVNIGAFSFYAIQITTIALPVSVKSLKEHAFSYNSISSLTLSDGLDSIGNYAFSGNQLTSLTIPSTVSYIGDDAFEQNRISPSLVIPSSVKHLGESSFSHNEISSITFNYGLEHIGRDAFDGNYDIDLRDVTLPNSIIYIGENALGYSDFKLPCPYRENYTVKWNNGQSSCGEEVNGYNEYVATFEPFSYTITYVLNGGINGYNPDAYSREENIVFSDPTKSGYPFEGWFSNADFSGNPVTKIDQGTFGDTTLYAKWGAIITYNITYVLDGGENGLNPAIYTVEESFSLDPPTMVGSTFVGWFDNPSFTGSIITTIEYGTTGDLTFYAKWDNYFDVTFTAAEYGTILGENVQSVMKGSNSSLVGAIAHYGYRLQKWVSSDGDSITNANPLEVVGVQTDSSLTAIFEEIACTEIILDTVTITVYDTVSVEDTLRINITITELSAPDNINEIRVYPNPTTDLIWIDCSEYLKIENYTLKIIDVSSVVKWSTVITQQEYSINLDGYATGLYFLQIFDSKNQMIEVRKIILY